MNIYVGNLSFETTDEDLRNEFAAFGEITSANVIKDRMTNRSRGFGFVEMANKDEALKAIAALHGKSIDGRTITASEAKPREDRPARSNTSRGGFGGGAPRTRTW